MIEKDSVTIYIPKTAAEPMVARIKALAAAIQNLNPLWQDKEFLFEYTDGNLMSIEMKFCSPGLYGQELTLLRSLQELCFPEENNEPVFGWVKNIFGLKKRVKVWLNE